MATDKRIECMKVDEEGVAVERVHVEFPQKFAYIKEMTINGITYINDIMTGADGESLSTP